MVNQLLFEQDMAKPVQLRQIHGSLFENDNNGLQIGVRVFRNGEVESLIGSIICEVMRNDGAIVVVIGERSGNLACASIPSNCLMPGPIKMVMKNVDGEQKTTILAVSGVVLMVNGSAYIDPGTVIPDLTEYTELVNRAEAAATSIANLSTDTQLIVGDRYRCVVAKS